MPVLQAAPEGCAVVQCKREFGGASVFSYEILKAFILLAVWAVGSLAGELIAPLFRDTKSAVFFRRVNVVILALSLCAGLWLALNRERFHWYYDIATGEPVDHYSTYAKCVVCVAISAVSSAAACAARYLRAKKQRKMAGQG